jgi:hypothetical protein
VSSTVFDPPSYFATTELVITGITSLSPDCSGSGFSQPLLN